MAAWPHRDKTRAALLAHHPLASFTSVYDPHRAINELGKSIAIVDFP